MKNVVIILDTPVPAYNPVCITKDDFLDTGSKSSLLKVRFIVKQTDGSSTLSYHEFNIEEINWSLTKQINLSYHEVLEQMHRLDSCSPSDELRRFRTTTNFSKFDFTEIDSVVAILLEWLNAKLPTSINN